MRKYVPARVSRAPRVYLGIGLLLGLLMFILAGAVFFSPNSSGNVLSPPNGATLTANTEVDLAWPTISDKVEYKVELWGEPYSTMTPCNWQGGTYCHIGVMWPGHTYSWHVMGRNNAGESGWSPTYTFTIGSGSRSPSGSARLELCTEPEFHGSCEKFDLGKHDVSLQVRSARFVGDCPCHAVLFGAGGDPGMMDGDLPHLDAAHDRQISKVEFVSRRN